MLLFLSQLALAAPPRSAITVDPHGAVLGLAASGALKLPVFDANLGAQRMFTEAVGGEVRVDVTHTRTEFLRLTYTGVRMGPRFSLRRRGLHDWNVRPFVVAGVSVLTVGKPLARYGVVGSGATIGRTWVWGRFVLDLGAGLYTSVNLPLGGEGDLADPPPPVLPIKPTFHGSIGVAL